MHSFTGIFSFVLPTKIIFGEGSLKNLPEEIQLLNAKRPLIVTDKGVVKCGIAETACNILKKEGIGYGVFDGVEANPKDYNVKDGANVYNENGCDSIIGLGGGSPIDCAKAIGVLVANNASDIKAYEGKKAKSNPLPPLICIPTTSGTGSELTFSAVINDTANNYKMTVKNDFTAAKLALCDPALTLTVPPAVTAATGMDALTHAIEAYTANCCEPISDALALHSIMLISKNLLAAYKDGGNIKARSNMLMGSMLGGMAFSHSDVASVHCISEALGGMFDLPHGVCNAVILPYMMEYCMDYAKERYAHVARAMGIAYLDESEGAAKAVAAVKKLALDVGLPLFSSFNIDKENYPAIADAAAKNISTNSNPRPMDVNNYLEVLNMMK